MAATTAKTASCIDQLNRIAMGETGAGRFLSAWAEVTENADLACTLRLIAARETSHGEVFRRRVVELGGEVCCEPDREGAARLALYANPAISDLEKIGPLSDGGDPFGAITRSIAEGEYDPLTTSLMTWYLAEERDSLARLRECAAALRARGKAERPAASQPSADAEAIMACMTEGFARLEKSMEKLARAVK